VNISIIGTGYVGLVTGTCLSDFGLNVICVDQDKNKIDILNSGGIPIYEPNLEPLIKKNVSAGRLTFTTDLEKAVKESKVIFIAVGTPSNDDGSANLVQIEEVAKQIALSINNYKVIVIKSTVPVGTTRKIKEIINKYQTLSLRATEGSAAIPSSVIPAKAGIHPSVIAREQSDRSNPNLNRRTGVSPVYNVIARSEATKQSQPTLKPFDFDVVSNPEFLREGSAVYDFTHPDKIVFGYENDKAKQIMQEIYRPLYLIDTPFVFTTPETAELIKYACNAFLATKITFINEIANLCDKVIISANKRQRECFNPLAMENSRRILPDLTYCQDEYETAEHCDALVIATEWNQFRNLDLLKIKKLLKSPILLDLRNLYEPAVLKSLGLIYEGVGRK